MIEVSGVNLKTSHPEKETLITPQLINSNFRNVETQYIKELINQNSIEAQYIWVKGETSVGKTYFIERILKDTQSFLKCTSINEEMYVWKSIVDQLLHKILIEEENLNEWKNELLKINNIENLLCLSPKLSIIIGETSDGKNTYFYEPLISFLNLFMKQGEPLIIWLDNIEQIDDDSKHFLSQLMLQQNLNHFVLIGSGNFKDEFFSKGITLTFNNHQLDESLLKLPENEKERTSLQSPINIVLSKASVLQHPFTIEQLVTLTAKSQSEIENIMNEAISKKFIHYNRKYKTYGFNQNEIKQHFYLQLKKNERERLHLKASQLYRETGEDLYRKLYHANLVPTLFDRKKLIQWNYKAAIEKKAKKNLESAFCYIEIAVSKIEKSSWIKEHTLVFNIFFEKAAILFNMNRFIESEKMYKELLNEARNNDQKVCVYLALLRLKEVEGEYEQSLQLGNQIFELINFRVDEITSKRQLSNRKKQIYRKLKKVHPSDLPLAPIQSDKQMHAMFQVLYLLGTISYRQGHASWIQWVIILLEETFKGGIAPQSAYGIAGYSTILDIEYSDIQFAMEWGQFALALVEDSPELYIPVKALLLICFTNNKKLVDQDFLFTTREVNGARLINNNWMNKHYLILNYRLLIQQSYPLAALYQYLHEGTKGWEINENDPFFKFKIILEDFLSYLMGKAFNYDQFQNNLKHFLALDEPEIHFYLYEKCYVMGYLANYMHGNFLEAFKVINEIIDQYEQHKIKISNISYHLYYYFVIGFEVVKIVDKKEKKKILKKMRAYKEKLAKISLRNLTLRHRYLTASAIYLSILNRKNQVVLYCEEAIEFANELGLLQDVAILSEGYAKWNLHNHKKNKAKFYMNEAYHAYRELGVIIKVKEIESEFPYLITNLNVSDMERTDYHSIFLSTQALSQEIELPHLLDKLLNIMLQNAGGQYGALLMEEDGVWNVRAYGHFQSIKTKTIKLNAAKKIVPETIIQYVIRTKEELFLRNVQKSIFHKIEYVSEHNLKSVLCLPILHQNKLLCVLYMENDLTKDTFTEKQLSILKLLSSQCAISISNAKLFTDLQQLKESLEKQVEERTNSLQKSIEATTEAVTEMTIYAERNRIAQEIHDIVGHTLTSTILQIEAGKRLINKDIDSALSRLQKAQDSVRHSLNEIRNSVHMLKEDKYYDLQEAMWDLIAETERNTGVKIEAEIDSVQSIPQITKKLLYHALQESITNGIKHGGSTYFCFILRHLGNSIHFEISDNGRGSNNIQLGFGLKVMEERVQQLKGTLTLQSQLNEGYKLSIHLPL